MNLPLVSVGIPTYNRPKKLAKTLHCLVNQSYKNLEIIVSDNASTDPEVEKTVLKYCHDARVKYIKQPQNLGAESNFGFVLDDALGDYFMWAADDDEFDAEFIEKSLKVILSKPQFVACWSDITHYNESGDLQLQHCSNPDLSLLKTTDALIEWTFQSGWYGVYALYKTSYVKEAWHRICNNYQKVFGKDVLIISELLLKGKIAKVHEPLFRYEHKDIGCDAYHIKHSPDMFDDFSKANPYYVLLFSLLKQTLVSEIPRRKKMIYLIKFLKKYFGLKNLWASWIIIGGFTPMLRYCLRSKKILHFLFFIHLYVVSVFIKLISKFVKLIKLEIK